jgi:hypothetical protein
VLRPELPLCNIKVVRRYIHYFHSALTRNEVQVLYQISASLIVIYEVSLLTLWVGQHVPLTLASITRENHQDWDFGGRQLLFVGDLLRLPLVVQNMAIPVVHRSGTQNVCQINEAY